MAIIPYILNGKTAYRAKFNFQRKQYTKSGFTRRDKALEWIVSEKKRLKKEAIFTPMEKGLPVLMYSQMCDQYIQDALARMQQQTVAEKMKVYHTLAIFLKEDCPATSITLDAAREHIASVLKATGNKTANRHLTHLKALWNWFCRIGRLSLNPWAMIPPYPVDKARRYVPPEGDVKELLKAAEPWEREWIFVELHTAARQNELINLLWKDIDFSRNTITLWTRKRRGGGRTPRVLNMGERLRDVFMGIRARHKDLPYSEHVFLAPSTGKPFHRQTRALKYLFIRLCAKVNRKRAEEGRVPMVPFTMHSLRHFVALKLRDSKQVTPHQIQAFLGHTKLDTTDIYLRSLAPDLLVAATVLDAQNLYDPPVRLHTGEGVSTCQKKEENER